MRKSIPWRVRARIMAECFHKPDGAFICGYCCARLTEDQVYIDHIVPVARGGGNDVSNLQVTCQRCNLMKGARHHLDAEDYINAVLELEAGK